MKEVVLKINGREEYFLRRQDVYIKDVQLIINGEPAYATSIIGKRGTPSEQSIEVDSGKDRKPLVIKVSYSKNRDGDYRREYRLKLKVKDQGELPFGSIFAGGGKVVIYPLSKREGVQYYIDTNTGHRALDCAKRKAATVEKEIREQYAAFLADLDAEPSLPEGYTITI